jgi:acyl-CoA thioester hydrolase
MVRMDTFEWPVRVYYEDTDAGGVVYHSQYLNFLERARTEWLRAAGFEQDKLRDDPGLIFVVNRVAIDFLQPARFNDALKVTVALREQRGARLLLDQQVVQQDNDKILARAEVQVVCVDSQRFRPLAVPTFILEKLRDAD